MMECPHCKSFDVMLSSVDKYSKKRIYCKQCRTWSTKFDAPKVLIFDIETSRMQVSIFRKGEQYVRWQQVDKTPFIISWAGKWLFSPDHISDTVTPKEARARNDKRVVKSLHKEMSNADLVITHNGNKFDIKVMNWYFIKYGLIPNNRYKSIDTIAAYKSICAPPLGYSLDALSQELGYDGKIHTDIDLWAECEQGNADALERMNTYNINDIFTTEDIYLRVRGWMKSHPNMAVFFEMYQELDEGQYMCPRCAQVIDRVKFTRKWRSPAGYVYKSCNCPHCGAVLRRTERTGGQRITVK